ncbi:GNAT family N-acetyltransferase [Brevibacillus laterosporus]|uniref:GNAT family N-acetyltransferase n=1 Tax=Brevibacillus laterosporus TaxID=1465 RepID=UPI001443C0A8|nr:GNAT family N-acetyltransferase [Brevibacillus laterosporus]NKQ21517.1 GNAT family N-acetyltransferase [Brevibacillus laterosporus]WNX32500.1 GNAT family N-acetyltransferase [Brevibacillus laterosporus]
MFVLMKNDITKIDIEKEIMNSNIEYNVIAHDKELLESKDIFEEHLEAQKLHLERYLVKKDGEYIGILDYGMSSPRAKKPWLSLLVIHNKYQGYGHAKKIYMTYENIMKNKQVQCIQIAVHATNKKALHFWTSLGYRYYDERTYKDKVFYSLEKNLD